MAFGKIGLWGIDELLTYHYPEAEFLPILKDHTTRILEAFEDRAFRRHRGRAALRLLVVSQQSIDCRGNYQRAD